MTNIQITITKQILNTNIEILVSLKSINIENGRQTDKSLVVNTVV